MLANGRLWHKAAIRISGTFSKRGGAVNLQRMVTSICKRVVLFMQLTTNARLTRRFGAARQRKTGCREAVC